MVSNTFLAIDGFQCILAIDVFQCILAIDGFQYIFGHWWFPIYFSHWCLPIHFSHWWFPVHFCPLMFSNTFLAIDGFQYLFDHWWFPIYFGLWWFPIHFWPLMVCNTFLAIDGFQYIFGHWWFTVYFCWSGDIFQNSQWDLRVQWLWWAPFRYKDRISKYENLVVRRLIFIMDIPILVRFHLYIELAPRSHIYAGSTFGHHCARRCPSTKWHQIICRYNTDY